MKEKYPDFTEEEFDDCLMILKSRYEKDKQIKEYNESKIDKDKIIYSTPKMIN